MPTKTIALALATTLLGSTAWAQTNPPAPSSSPPNTAAPAQSGQFLTQEKPGQWRASKLRGLDVYNNNNEKVGDIREVLLDQSGKAEAMVIGVGGFLGLGEHDVALPFSEIRFVDQPRTTNTSDNRPAGANTSNSGASNTAANRPAADNPSASGNTAATASSAPTSRDGANRTAANNPSGTGNTAANTTGSTTASTSRSDANRGYPDHAVISMNKDQLRNAPAFQYAR